MTLVDERADRQARRWPALELSWRPVGWRDDLAEVRHTTRLAAGAPLPPAGPRGACA